MKKMLTVDSSVRELSGVGEVRAACLEKMGISTLRDLVKYTPRAYENRGNIRTLTQGTDGEKSAFLLTVGSTPKTVRLKGRLTITKFRAFDETGTVDVVFYNQSYVQSVFSIGAVFRFWGALNYSKTWTLSSPAYEPYYDGAALPDYISLYPLSSGISRKVLTTLIDAALAVDFPDYLPESIRLKNHLPTLSHALRKMHHPETPADLNNAMRRLVFDELFCMSVAVAVGRSAKHVPTVKSLKSVDLTPLFALLPYRLTNAQKRVISEISADIISSANYMPAMRRILIGDVGSGKTICAIAALYIAAKNGYQAALMAPTEILANQHYQDISGMLGQLGVGVTLLTGSTTQKEKKKIYDALSAGDSAISIVIGTHALLTDKVQFSNLILTITDEQHRFGIMQRSALDEKASHGHLLVMSATPIPRTLALSLYGDLSISRLDEMPVGRQHIDTFVVDESYRDRLNGFIAKQVASGGQVYIVCPAIEEAESAEEDGGHDEVLLNSLSPTAGRAGLKSAKAYAEYLKKDVFPNLSVGLLHGQMKSAEKEAIMTCFVGGDIDILVSTTVIEVGVNVPNATLMIVENAENFGLSQLHQLRGRVGRGTRKSYCILVSDAKAGNAMQRLHIMTQTDDGYEIAERDLLLRGPGDFFSGAQDSRMRQSGGMNLRLARCCDDPNLMNAAFAEASSLIQQDPTLENHPQLMHELTYYFSKTENDIS